MTTLTNDEHFQRLNAYSKTKEWQEDRYDFDALVGQRWGIPEEVFYEMLGVLPPVRWRREGAMESFLMSEALTGNIRSMYSRTTYETPNGPRDEFRHEYVRYPEARRAVQA